MEKESHALLSAAGRSFNRQLYYNAPAAALIPLGKQFIVAGGNDEKFGQNIVRGVIEALGSEGKERFPRCPNCGRRHPPNNFTVVRATIQAALDTLRGSPGLRLLGGK